MLYTPVSLPGEKRTLKSRVRPVSRFLLASLVLSGECETKPGNGGIKGKLKGEGWEKGGPSDEWMFLPVLLHCSLPREARWASGLRLIPKVSGSCLCWALGMQTHKEAKCPGLELRSKFSPASKAVIPRSVHLETSCREVKSYLNK